VLGRLGAFPTRAVLALVERTMDRQDAGDEPSATPAPGQARRGRWDRGDELSPRMGAALSAAWLGLPARGCEAAGAAASASDQAAAKVIRALRGAQGALDASVFAPRSRALGLAAVAAIERVHGNDELDLLVFHALRSRFDLVRSEAMETFKRVVGRAWTPRALAPAAQQQAVEGWWLANGAAVKARRRPRAGSPE
jgi:hypothetical protein